MPWLESRLADPDDRWIRFTNAFVNVPMCCPSRAIDPHREVRAPHRRRGQRRRRSISTSPRRSRPGSNDAGYQTALIGKYLNGYPWDRGPYVPDGWDRFLAKRNLGCHDHLRAVPLRRPRGAAHRGADAPGIRDLDARRRGTRVPSRGIAEAPWFLVFAPTAPHEPWTPAPQDEGSFRSAPIVSPSLTAMNEVAEAPGWVRALPPITEAEAATLDRQRRRMLETLGAVDRAVDDLVEEIRARDELGRTLIVFLTDNGFSFGEHRWVGKRCPYDACIRTPLIVRTPWTDAGERRAAGLDRRSRADDPRSGARSRRRAAGTHGRREPPSVAR